MQQDVAVQVDGKDITIGPQLQEDRRRVRLSRWLCGVTHCAGVITLTSAGRARPTSPPGLGPFYSFISILRTMQSATHSWGESLPLYFSHCSFPQACRVYSLLALQGLWLYTESQSITQL